MSSTSRKRIELGLFGTEDLKRGRLKKAGKILQTGIYAERELPLDGEYLSWRQPCHIFTKAEGSTFENERG